MRKEKKISRRQALRILTVAGAVGFTGLWSIKARAQKVGAMMPGKGWLEQDAPCDGDNTPLQFIPKTAPDPHPLEDELKKYPKCPHCGMDRTMWNHSRHLVHYDDDLAVGTCSLHCLAISLSINLDRGIKAIYAADFGAEGRPRPMINVDDATYLIGSGLGGTMTGKSKMAFGVADKAKAAQDKQGGELGSFDDALKAAYLSMADDTIMIRRRRIEKMKIK